MGTGTTFYLLCEDPIIESEVNRSTLIPKQVPVSLLPSSKAPVHFDGEKMNFQLKENFRIAQSETTLKGPHNLINTMAAVSAVFIAGAPLDAIKSGTENF